ncbi:MAG: alpha-2-macroglobulin family protein [Candidatus Accumulibacter sp.]|nr:alpha-2-macroglobulin family protein [Accumulibacter sp.]
MTETTRPRAAFFATSPAAFLSRLLPWLAFALLCAPAARGEPNDASDYRPARGAPFFVLTDTQFGSSDEALLRVEIPANEGGLEAAREYGGVEIRLYRVPRPLDFLKAQKNLHRVDVAARPRDEGVANLLSYLWSNFWNKTRRAWRELFSGEARQAATQAAPALKTRFTRPRYQPATNFRPLEGFDLVQGFRYPLAAAKPIAPPEVKLEGSSSEWLPKNGGNFYVPLGQLEPGLYLAEAILGTHRAVTLVFVADTVAVTKMASGALTVWTAHRTSGQAVAGAKLSWTDGRGALASATTDERGLATLKHASPERTYLLGEDASGGVFVSENFYYDSEIHDTKLYAVSDRPLYRPGDRVNLKFLARAYASAAESAPAKAGEIEARVFDPNGAPVLSVKLPLSPDTGADTGFRLPEDAVAGGYEIRVRHGDKRYGAAFRVAEYVKPHFEITLIPDREHFKTGEPVSGRIRLAYPDGKPVKNAAVELTLRAQTLTMVQGELRYGGLFPVRLSTASLTSDINGEAAFSLPPAREPSRLILSMLATDGAAYRVRGARELLVERASASWRLTSATRFSLPGAPVGFRLEAENPEAPPALPTTWKIVRLEDRTQTRGSLDASVFDGATRTWTPRLERPGSYSLMLRDADGNLAGATAHWVGGGDGKDGVQAIPGTLELVADKERYRPGEVAEVLMSFSEPVDEALLTLERDAVDAAALLSEAGRRPDAGPGWVSAERLAPNQWRARVPVREDYAPNMTFSVAYVKNGDYVFQNAGLVVENPRITVAVTPDKAVYAPGETVTIDLAATLQGQPARALLTVSVVDEMIYALQPEIAPDIVEFFQHVRRNNVRTGASLNFIAYDEAADYAADAARQPPARHRYNERGVKVQERARRDDTDTAAWQPSLMTDAAGRARFSFRMPDALSRWRVTVRAVALDAPGGKGVYGQRVSYLRSDKDFYAKWTSPAWMREGDAPVARLAVFNNTDGPREVEIAFTLMGRGAAQKTTLQKGVNYLPFALPPFSGTQTARLEIKEGGRIVDALETPLTADPPGWRGMAEQIVSLSAAETALALPADARAPRLAFAAAGGEHFLRIADSLVEYPWGCVEQTSSRLIPLALAAPLLAPEGGARGPDGRLWQMLYGQRLRLAALAGPNAVFGWWGAGASESAFLSAYAYYADWLAARALGLSLPAGHWERVLDIYREHAGKDPLLHRVLALWFIRQIGLPVRTQLQGALADLSKSGSGGEAAGEAAERTESPLMAAPESPLGLAYARVLAAHLAKEAGLSPGAAFAAELAAAESRLEKSPQPSAQALLLLAGKKSVAVSGVLDAVSEATPTIDRALTLVWTRRALSGADGASAGPSAGLEPAGEWRATPAIDALFGRKEWRWTGATPPRSLRLENAPARGTVAILRYEAGEDAPRTTLPVTLERRLFRLERRDFKDGKASYRAAPVKDGEALSTQELYLDELRLESSRGEHRYGLLEIPLPPGASVEPGTWGVRLLEDAPEDESAGQDGSPLERSRAEEKRGRYGVPVESLTPDGVTVRHLLRFAQTGRFTLPPARYYPMYQPARKAYAEGGDTEWEVK